MTTSNTELLIAYIRKWLHNKEWDALRLATEAGISSPSIYDLLNGKTKQPKPDTLRKIAAVIGDTPETLFKLAGILPESEDSDVEEETWREIARIIARLPAERQADALRWLESYADMVSREARQTKANPAARKAKGTA